MDGKARGLMLGLAVGDALGAPTEFLSLAQIKDRFGPRGIEGYVRGRGMFTDDTQLSMAVAEALVEAGRRPLEELMGVISGKFVAWLDSPDNFRAPGMATRLAVGAIKEGRSWKKSGDPASKGCGSVMRTAPVGYFYRDPARLKEIARAVGAATHTHPTADAACLAASLCVRMAAEEVPLAEWLLRVRDFTGGISAEFDATLDRLAEALPSADEEAGLARIGAGFGGWTADEVFASALYCVLRSPGEFRACVLRAVNGSGDTDSIGCVAGAIQGTRLGVSAIPPEWVEGIERREDLERMADRLAEARG